VKVRVQYTADISDDYRLALCHQWGECGRKATRAEVQQHLMLVGSSNDDDLMQEYDECDVCAALIEETR
jgi:hypothetical protein